MLLFSWTPVREVCPNYEVVMFQPWTETPLDLVSVDNCYIAILLNSCLPSLAATRFPPGGGYPLTPRSSLPFPPSRLHTWSFYHLSVICLQPRIPRNIAACIRIWLRYLPASNALTTPSTFPTPHPCCCRNIDFIYFISFLIIFIFIYYSQWEKTLDEFKNIVNPNSQLLQSRHLFFNLKLPKDNNILN